MYQQLWGYKVEEKLYLGVREQKRLNTTVLDLPRKMRGVEIKTADNVDSTTLGSLEKQIVVRLPLRSYMCVRLRLCCVVLCCVVLCCVVLCCVVLRRERHSAVYRGRAMAQAVSRRPLTAEARVRARVNPCGICGGKVVLGQVFLRVLLFSPVNIIPPSLSKLISSGGWTIFH
jgi:hypothetical protein